MSLHTVSERFGAWVVALTVLLLAGCGGSDTPAKNNDAVKAYQATHPRLTVQPLTDPAGTVTIATSDESNTLDPQNTQDGGDVKVINNIYQTLIRIDPTDANKLIPELAESWQVSDDGKTITFAIRKGVKFHDGAALDAEAVRLSLKRERGSADDPVPTAPYRGAYKMIDSVEADGMTLTVTLSRPVARVALRNLSMFPASIISPKLLAASRALGDDAQARSHFIAEWGSGTGPFFLARFDKAAARVRLQRFDDYWGGQPKVAALVFRQVRDPQTQIEQLKSGEVDMLDDPPRPQWQQFEADPTIRVYRWWALNVCVLSVNVGHELTRDIRVRRAIQLAIDRHPLIELYYGTARPTYGIVAQPLADYDPDFRPPGVELPLDQRRAKARALLEEANAVGRKLTILFPADPRPYLPTPDKVADKVRQQLIAIGLDVQIEGRKNSDLFNSINLGRHDLVLGGWMSDNADADNFYMPLTCGQPNADGTGGKPAPFNGGRTFDMDIYRALIAAQALTDPAKRIAAYRQVERRQQTEFIGYIPLVNTQQGHAYGPRLNGVEVDGLGAYRFHKATLK